MAPFDSSRRKRAISELSLAASFLDFVPMAMLEIRSKLRAHRESLSVPQFRILAALWQSSKTNKELAEHIGVSVPTMSRMVQSLVDQELIEKSTAKVDRRELKIQLSSRGRTRYEKIRAQARQGLSEHFKKLNEEERELVSQAIELIQPWFENKTDR